MAVRVGRWDCQVCGNIGNYGPHTKCDSCGASRPSDVKFYLPKDAEIVTDKKRLQESRAGVDWICGHCHSQNKSQNTSCNSCGNPKDETSQDVNLKEKEYNLDEVPMDGSKKRKVIHPLEQQRLAQKTSKKSGTRKKILYGFLAIVGIIALLRIFPVTTTVTVDSFAWERTMQMLHYEAVVEEAWSTPNGAFDVSSFQAISGYNRVSRGYETRTRTVQVPVGQESYVCGQTDNGNGYFTDRYCTRTIYESREETYQEEVFDEIPIYKTKYRYKIMRWIEHKENLLKSSAQNHEAFWPPKTGKTDTKLWREGEKKGTYYVLVKDDGGDIHKEKVGPTFWEGLEVGQDLKGEKMFLFGYFYGLAEPKKDS